MKLTITIEMDNAAFEDRIGPEAARILRNLAVNLPTYLEVGDEFPLRDSNGNTVGTAEVKED